MRCGGAATDKTAKCRFVFGTNENLGKALAEGRMRFDLYNRINGIEVRLPSVAERIGGAGGGGFIERAVEGLCARRGLVAMTRGARAMFGAFARRHPWHGNFRELERFFNVLQREALVRGGDLARRGA